MSRKTKRLVIGALVLVVGVPALSILTILGVFGVLNHRYGRTTGALVSDGVRREYLLHVPPTLDRTKPPPLVISLHAAMNWPAFEEWLSGWDRVADANGFLVVYPAGMGSGPKTWYMDGARTPSTMPDVRFIAALIDTLASTYRIDRTRIYADGMSNGGGMAFALSCTLSDRIAAIGAVSAAQSLPWSWCADSTPVPAIVFHGTADPVVPYDGGKVWIAPAPFPSLRTWIASFARRNRCAAHPVDSVVAADVTRRAYTRCANDASVVLYSIRGGGHAWPGGNQMWSWVVGRTTTSIDATSTMWAFFSEHPLHRQ